MKARPPKRVKPKPGRWHQAGMVLIHVTNSTELPEKGQLCCSYVTTDPDAPNQASYFGASRDEGGGNLALILQPKNRDFAPVMAWADDAYSANQFKGARFIPFNERWGKWEGEYPWQRRMYVPSCSTLRELIARTGEGKRKMAQMGIGRPVWAKGYHHYNEVWVETSDVEVVGVAKLSVGAHGETVVTPMKPQLNLSECVADEVQDGPFHDDMVAYMKDIMESFDNPPDDDMPF